MATAPEAHARLSPSGAKKWFACPGSLTMEAPFPNKSSSHSDDGTAMHDVAARCLTGGLRASSFVGEWIPVGEGRKVQLDEEMADLVQGYVDFIRTKAIGHTLLVEQRLPFSKFVGVPDQFGTADSVIVNWAQGCVEVDDLKTGHRGVECEANPQLMTYGVAVIGELYEKAMAQAGGDDDQLF
jgi:hypothetical protein